MTSVKEFRIETHPTSDTLGRGAFIFTDDYSVFDWGKMPDSIPNKGASICAMGAHNFELLESAGIPTHYRGVISKSECVALDESYGPPREMAIDLTQTPELPYHDGEYDYSVFHEAAGENFLIPLEIIFRNTIPIGSSVRRRFVPKELNLPYDDWPNKSISLPEPVVEFSTKFEESDRYLSRENADYIAGKASIIELEELAQRVNSVITKYASTRGFAHEDGKIECLYHQGQIRVADVVGTFDENRFSYDGLQLSKEFIRQYYRRSQPDWITALEEAKETATNEDIEDWRTLCNINPDPLPEHILVAASDMYTAGANAYLDRELFKAPSMQKTIRTIRDLA